MEVPLVIGGIILFVGAIIFFSHMYEKKQTEAMRAIADELSLSFHPDGDGLIQQTCQKMHLFDQGRRRKFRNMLTGDANNVSMAIFTYQYTTGGGKHQQTHSQTVIFFQATDLSLPEFEVRPEHVFHKIGKVFGYKDINFDSHPQFSKQYLLRGPNEDAIRNYFDLDRLDFIETLGKRISLEARHDHMIFYRPGKRIKPDAIREFMAEGFRVYSEFKREAVH